MDALGLPNVPVNRWSDALTWLKLLDRVLLYVVASGYPAVVAAELLWFSNVNVDGEVLHRHSWPTIGFIGVRKTFNPNPSSMLSGVVTPCCSKVVRFMPSTFGCIVYLVAGLCMDNRKNKKNLDTQMLYMAKWKWGVCLPLCTFGMV